MGLGALVMAYEVVMATFNGARFLDRQIASILDQTIPPERIVVADDGSTDHTLNRLRFWQQKSPVPIKIFLQEKSGQLGSCRNFERLLQASEADYVMLSDQDDLWDRDKAERLLRRMDVLQRHLGSDRPLLVHGDLRLIDDRDRCFSASFHRVQGLYPLRLNVLEIGMQNVVTGCASLLNRACVFQALPFPEEVVLHDWWLALVASQADGLAYEPGPCVSYRQHGGNVVGAVGWPRQLCSRFRQVLASQRTEAVKRLISPGLLQLRACLHRFGPEELAQGLDQLWSRSAWIRLRAAKRLGLRKHGLWRSLGFYAALLITRPSEH
jgi:glycosyltransferase involved in cell wall biosynthesis